MPASARTWRALSLLLLAVVSYLALTPKLESGLDMVGHLMAFTALAVSGTWLSSIPRHVHRPLLRVIRLEVLQLFVPRCDALTDDAATLNEKVDAMLTAMMQLKG